MSQLKGGLAMGVRGGPKRHHIWGVVAAIGMSGSGYFMAGLRLSTWLIESAQFVILFFIPICAALSQAVWHKKAAPEIQGRVFAMRAMSAYLIIPLQTWWQNFWQIMSSYRSWGKVGGSDQPPWWVWLVPVRSRHCADLHYICTFVVDFQQLRFRQPAHSQSEALWNGILRRWADYQFSQEATPTSRTKLAGLNFRL